MYLPKYKLRQQKADPRVMTAAIILLLGDAAKRLLVLILPDYQLRTNSTNCNLLLHSNNNFILGEGQGTLNRPQHTDSRRRRKMSRPI